MQPCQGNLVSRSKAQAVHEGSLSGRYGDLKERYKGAAWVVGVPLVVSSVATALFGAITTFTSVSVLPAFSTNAFVVILPSLGAVSVLPWVAVAVGLAVLAALVIGVGCALSHHYKEKHEVASNRQTSLLHIANTEGMNTVYNEVLSEREEEFVEWERHLNEFLGCNNLTGSPGGNGSVAIDTAAHKRLRKRYLTRLTAMLEVTLRNDRKHIPLYRTQEQEPGNVFPSLTERQIRHIEHALLRVRIKSDQLEREASRLEENLETFRRLLPADYNADRLRARANREQAAEERASQVGKGLLLISTVTAAAASALGGLAMAGFVSLPTWASLAVTPIVIGAIGISAPAFLLFAAGVAELGLLAFAVATLFRRVHSDQAAAERQRAAVEESISHYIESDQMERIEDALILCRPALASDRAADSLPRQEPNTSVDRIWDEGAFREFVDAAILDPTTGQLEAENALSLIRGLEEVRNRVPLDEGSKNRIEWCIESLRQRFPIGSYVRPVPASS